MSNGRKIEADPNGGTRYFFKGVENSSHISDILNDDTRTFWANQGGNTWEDFEEAYNEGNMGNFAAWVGVTNLTYWSLEVARFWWLKNLLSNNENSWFATYWISCNDHIEWAKDLKKGGATWRKRSAMDFARMPNVKKRLNSIDKRIEGHKWTNGLPMKNAEFLYIATVGDVRKFGITNNIPRRMNEHAKDKNALVTVMHHETSHISGFVDQVEKVMKRRMRVRGLIIEGNEWTLATPEYLQILMEDAIKTVQAFAA